MTDFRPDKDGFTFQNNWDFSTDTDILNQMSLAYHNATSGLKGALQNVLGTAIDVVAAINFALPQIVNAVDGPPPAGYGMCGGMGFTILDYWFNHWHPSAGNGSVPVWTPAQQGALRGYIRNRLADSLGIGGVAANTLLWMTLLDYIPDTFGGGSNKVRSMTRGELTKVMQQIDQGNPVPIALVGLTKVVFNQHQIVVYGYDDNKDGTFRLYVYDYNCGPVQNTIDLNFQPAFHVLVPSASGESCSSSDRGALRGFFVPNYKPQMPPIALGVSGSVAMSGNPGMDETITLTYTATNVGFGPTQPLQLYVAGRAGSVNVDAGGDGSPLAPIAEGASNSITVSAKIGPPAGPRVYSASAYLGPADGVNTWKSLPPAAGGIVAALTVNVADYPHWAYLGGPISSSPAVAADASGHWHVYATQGAQMFETIANPDGSWTPLAPFTSDFGSSVGQPVAARHNDGRIDVFYGGPSNALYHVVQSQPNGSWLPPASLGGTVTDLPAIAVNADGRLEVFASDANVLLSHCYEQPGGAGWSSWFEFSFGTQLVSAVRNAQGLIELYALWGGQAQRAVQPTPGGNWPSAWTVLTGAIGSDPVAAVNADGRIELFAVVASAGGASLVHNYQLTPGGAWSGWSSLGGSLSANYLWSPGYAIGRPSVVLDKSGHLHVFAFGGDGGVAWIEQSPSGAGGWTGWTSLGLPLASSPVAAVNPDGRIELFARAANNGLYHRWQTSPGGPWS